jgi:FtsH-binding integral membrane protein
MRTENAGPAERRVAAGAVYWWLAACILPVANIAIAVLATELWNPGRKVGTPTAVILFIAEWLCMLGLLRRRGALTGVAATLAYVVVTIVLLLAASLVVAMIAGGVGLALEHDPT